MATLDDHTSSSSGQSWSHWREKAEKQASKVKCEPLHVNDDSKGDSMKLRQEDMALYGLCPAQDEFYLVVCECCGRVVKPQALRRHLGTCEQSHGIRPESSSVSSHSFTDTKDKASSSSSSTSRSSKGHSHKSSSAQKSTKRPISPSAHQHQKDKSSQLSKPNMRPTVEIKRLDSESPKRSSSKSPSSASFMMPAPSEPPDKPKSSKEKDKDIKEPPAKAPKKEPVEMPQTTAAVTFTSSSTPLTISSLAMTKPQVTSVTTQPQVLQIPKPSSASAVSKEPEKSVPQVKTAVSTAVVTVAPKKPSLPVCSTSVSRTATVSTASSSKSSTSSSTSTTNHLGSKKSAPVKEKKNILCKDREYDPDKHCGVWVADDKRQCTRSLTCKTHALSLRRAVQGRSKPLDDLLREAKEAKGLHVSTSSSKSSSKSFKSPPSTPVTVAPSPFKQPSVENVISYPNLLSPPVKPPVPIVQQKEKLCLNSSFTRQSSLPIFPKREPVALPEVADYLSSDGEDEDDEKDKSDITVISHHPRPAAVNNFGAWRHGSGCYVFNRKEDLYRTAFFAAVERHLHPPPHKKLCVESNLPKGSTIMTNAKDPYEFFSADGSASNLLRSSSASRPAVKSPLKSKAAVGTSPSKTSDMTSPILLSSPGVFDLSDPFGSPTSSMPSTPSNKRRVSASSSPVTPRNNAGIANVTATSAIIGSSNIGTIPCSSPIAITIPTTLGFSLSTINANLAANKNAGHQIQRSKTHLVKDLSRACSETGGQLNGQLVSISAPDRSEMTHIQLNSLSEKCAKAKSKQNSSKVNFISSKSSPGLVADLKMSQVSKVQSASVHRISGNAPATLSRKNSFSSSSGGSRLLSSSAAKPGGLLHLDTQFPNSFVESSAVTLTTNSNNGSSGSTSTQPSPGQMSSPLLPSDTSSPTSPTPNGLLSPTQHGGKFGSCHLSLSDMSPYEQILNQHGPFSLASANPDSVLQQGLSAGSGHVGFSTPVPLSTAAATAQQLAAAALNLTPQPVSILTTNSSMSQIYATQVFAKSTTNNSLGSLQLHPKTGLKGSAGGADKVPLQPLSLKLVAPRTTVSNSQHPATCMVLQNATDSQAASNIPS